MIININSVLRYDALSVHKASIAIPSWKIYNNGYGALYVQIPTSDWISDL
mgnify:CR=1 FL=1